MVHMWAPDSCYYLRPYCSAHLIQTTYSCGPFQARGTPTARPSRPNAPAAPKPSSPRRLLSQESTRSISTQQVTALFFIRCSCFRLLSASPGHAALNPFLLSLTASEIVENIQARTWTASAVLEAYIARAAQAQHASNCFTEGTCARCWLLLCYQLAVAAARWALTFRNEYRSVLRRSHGRSA